MSLFSRTPDPRREFLQRLWAVDAALAKQGFPPFSPWWRKALQRFFLSGCRRWVARVGRRGGKSTTWAKVAVAVALYGAWSVPAGDLGVVAFLSVDRGEAQQRLRTIGAMLAALEVEHSTREGEIALTTRPCVFKVYAASVRAVGFTAILAIADEVARWRDVATGANPAREVIASLAPALATQPEARLILSSSPWTTHDFHATEFDKGDDETQLVSQAATWEANPSVSEADTHALEPDVRVWVREYGAKPSDAVSSFCSAEDFDACVPAGVVRRAPEPGGVRFHTVDVGLRHDHTQVTTWDIVLVERPGAAPVRVLRMLQIVSLVPTLLRRVKIEEVEQAVAAAHATYGGAVHSDSHYFDSLAPALKARGIPCHQAPMHPSAQSARAAAFQSRLSARTIELLDHPELRKQVLQAQLVHHSGGRISVSAPNKRGSFDDILDCVLLACDPDVSGKVPASSGGYEIVRDGGTGLRTFYRTERGIRLSVSPPAWAQPEHSRAQQERFSRGDMTAEDIAELGEAECQRRLFCAPPEHVASIFEIKRR